MGENGWASANVHNGGWGSTESKWSLLHQLGSHGEGRVPRPPVQADSLGASGPYGHNTLTGLYFTPSSFNQSTGHILCPSMHGFVFPSQKLVFIQMHLQLFSQPFCCCVFSHTQQLQTLIDFTQMTFRFQISESLRCSIFTAGTMGGCLTLTVHFAIKTTTVGGGERPNSDGNEQFLNRMDAYSAEALSSRFMKAKKKITFTVIVVTVIKEKSSELMKDELII